MTTKQDVALDLDLYASSASIPECGDARFLFQTPDIVKKLVYRGLVSMHVTILPNVILRLSLALLYEHGLNSRGASHKVAASD